jgi:hypothetical protein
MAFWIGVYPALFFAVLDAPVNRIVEAVRPGYFEAVAVEAIETPVGTIAGGQ